MATASLRAYRKSSKLVVESVENAFAVGSNYEQSKVYATARRALLSDLDQLAAQDRRLPVATFRLAQVQAISGHFNAARQTLDHIDLQRDVRRSGLRRKAVAGLVMSVDLRLVNRAQERNGTRTSELVEAAARRAHELKHALHAAGPEQYDELAVEAVAQAVVWNKLARSLRRHRPGDARAIAEFAADVAHVHPTDPAVGAWAKREEALGLLALAATTALVLEGDGASRLAIDEAVCGHLWKAHEIAGGLVATSPGPQGGGVTGPQLGALRGAIRRMGEAHGIDFDAAPECDPVSPVVALPVVADRRRLLRRVAVACVVGIGLAFLLPAACDHTNGGPPQSIVQVVPTPTPTPSPTSPPAPTPSPKPKPPTPPVPAPVQQTLAQKVHKLLHDAGFRGQTLRTMMAICHAENAGWDFDAMGADPGGGYSLGLCANSVTAEQVAEHPQVVKALLDPVQNAKQAFSTWRRGGLARWVTYNDGAYQLAANQDPVNAAYAANPGWSRGGLG